MAGIEWHTPFARELNDNNVVSSSFECSNAVYVDLFLSAPSRIAEMYTKC